jgi:iron complex transport system substrate-binding protein
LFASFYKRGAVRRSLSHCAPRKKALAIFFGWLMLWLPAVHAQLPKVASINLCADQLVMLLADDEQILSVTSLSREPAGAYFYEKAKQYPTNKGGSEKILSLAPDVVIAGQYTSVHSVKLLTEIGLNVKKIPIVNDFDTLFSNIRDVAAWLDQSERGETIIKDLEQRIAAIVPPPAVKPVAAVFDPNGYTTGADTLRGRLMARAGFENAAELAGIDSYGQLTLEQIIHLAPDALIDSPYSAGTYSRAQMISRHPALLQSGLDPYIISIPSRMTVCAGPWTVDVLEQLQSERLRLTAAQ